MVTSLQLFTQTLPASPSQINQRLEETVQELRSQNIRHPILERFDSVGVAQVAVGPDHICFLLENGSVHRIRYTVETVAPSSIIDTETTSAKNRTTSEPPAKKIQLSIEESFAGRPAPNPPGSGNPSERNPPQMARRTCVALSSRAMMDRHRSPRRLATTAVQPSESRSTATSASYVRARSISSAHLMSPARILLGESPAPPRRTSSSVSVPEELIDQVQTVLQGKSRRTISRELLRVNLDVNMAVNNLLGREDDESGSDEVADAEVYEGFMDDDLTGGWSYRSPQASGASRKERDSASLWQSTVVSLAEEVEAVGEGPASPFFVAIAALKSEMLCVDKEGKLYQWLWTQPSCYQDPNDPVIFHPKALNLGLKEEKIVMISSSYCRASMVSASGKICTIVDSSLSLLSENLEHPATFFPELAEEKVKELSVSVMYSCALTESGNIFWWGVMPLGYRHRGMEKTRSRSRRGKTSNAELEIGSTVVMRSAPMYRPGAIGIRINSTGEVQCGELQDNMWDLNNVASFKLLNPQTGEPLLNGYEPPGIQSDASDLSRSGTPQKRKVEATHGTGHIIESWAPKDIVVVEDSKDTPRIGKIVQMTEDSAHVEFTSDVNPNEDIDYATGLRSASVIRKSDLQTYRPAEASQRDFCIQRTPKKLRIAPGCRKVLACVANAKSIQMLICSTSGKLSLVNLSLSNGKRDAQNKFLCNWNLTSGKDKEDVKLITGGKEGFLIMLDGNRCVFPIEKDPSGNIKTPSPINCSPICSMDAQPRALGPPARSSRESRPSCMIIAFVIKRDSLMESVLAGQPDQVKSVLEARSPEQLENQLRMPADLNRNVFHACASLCAPRPRRDFPKNLSSIRSDYESARLADEVDIILSDEAQINDYVHLLNRQSIRRLETRSARQNAPAAPRPPPRTGAAVTDEPSVPRASDMSRTSEKTEPDDNTSRSNRAMEILQLLCQDASVQKVFLELMAAKDASGMTPFTYAVLHRAYEVAMLLLETTTLVIKGSYPGFSSKELSGVDSKTIDSLVMEFLFPSGSNADDSPLFVLCLNDVCTYTWTGARHIQQDVWECRTCGLTGSLCCCTECARTCHRGHDCKIKRSSPTAYCDCWEKSKCRSLVSGNEEVRLKLFGTLINMSTDLVVRPNSKGEHLLQYLVNTVGRQIGEQRHLTNTKTEARGSELLSPPKFAQQALTLLLGNYEALKMALMAGYPNPRIASNYSSAIQEDQFHLSYQSGTALLDRFVYVLLTKCNDEHVSAFLKTIQTAMGIGSDKQEVSVETQEMTSRLVRAIVRVYVVLTAESSNVACRSKSTPTELPSTLLKIRRILRALPAVAVTELCEAAEALIAPVRCGMARPTAGFNMVASQSDATRGSEELFHTDPLAERRRGRRRDHPPHGRQQSENAGMDEDLDSLIIPPDNDPRPARSGGLVRSSDAAAAAVRSLLNDDEPMSNTSGSRTASGNRERRREGDQSDMDIEEDHDSDGTDSEADDAGNYPGPSIFDSGQQGSGSQDNFSENDDEEDEEENSDHSNEDDEEEEIESDGVDMDESGSMEGDEDHFYNFLGDGRGPSVISIVRPGHSHSNNNSAVLPPGMRWASHQASSGSRGNHRSRGHEFLPTGSAGAGLTRQPYIYMDSFGMIRRSGGSSESVSPSFNSTFANLARSYAIITKEVSEIMSELREPTRQMIEISKLEKLEDFVDTSFKRTWNWLCQIMDSTEAQLRFGHALHQASETPTHPPARSGGHRDVDADIPVRAGLHHHTSSASSSRKSQKDNSAALRNDFLSYALSLMRAHNSEHGDSLPILDISALKHVAYILDALLFYVRITTDTRNVVEYRRALKYSDFAVSPRTEEDELEELAVSLDLQVEETPASEAAREDGRNQPFFRRSRSMTYLGSTESDPFRKSLADSMPLADRPQLLLPNVRREELFGLKLIDYSTETPSGMPASFKSPPVRLSLTSRQEDRRSWATDESDEEGNSDEPSSQGDEAMETSAPMDAVRRRIFGAFLTQDIVLGRWRQTLDLFSRVFADDVATEPGSLLSEIAPFPVREAKFRKEMERLRASQARELIMNVQRQRTDLIPETFAAMNAYFAKRGNNPYPCSKMKITFRDEPGEGNGVARSFFTVIAEGLLSQEKLPQLDRPAPPPPPAPSSRGDRPRWSSSEAARARSSIRDHINVLSPRAMMDADIARELLESRMVGSRNWPDVNATPYRSSRQSGFSTERADLADAVLHAVAHLRPSLSSSMIQRITGMIAQLELSELDRILHDDALLQARIDEAAQALVTARPDLRNQLPGDLANIMLDLPSEPVQASVVKVPTTPKEEEKEEKLNDDDDPLFYEPGRPGFFAPRPGKCSPARLLAFRNVGRLIGLGLLQGEIFPLSLTRGCVKYLLGHPVVWGDFAFHDPEMFETLRKMVVDCEVGLLRNEDLESMCLVFAVDLCEEEGGKDVELRTNGRNIQVTKDNIHDFVKLMAETRMCRFMEKCLASMKKGVVDVLHADSLSSLSPEDFRLLLNGVDRAIDIQQLASWTNWHDETVDKAQDKTRFKHWFWNTVDKFTDAEKQELLYFWTGSSAMPASEAGFAPLPSITIRPADDLHLPTANTCISRLYIPYYSSKAVLRAKTLMAIKTKNFGFV